MSYIDLEKDVKAAAIPIRGVKVEDPKLFMEELRAKTPEVVIQAIDATYVADIDHLWMVVRQAWTSYKKGVSKVKFDLDILLRVACNSRLTHALKTVGVKKGVSNIIFVAVGHEEALQLSVEILSKQGEASDNLLQPAAEKEKFLRKHHNISDLTLQSTLLKNRQLGANLAEKAAVALSGKR